MKVNIYKITNDINDFVYIGTTVRDVQVRFSEHCFDSRSTSQIHKMIKELGYIHFKCDLLETCELEDIQVRKLYYLEANNITTEELAAGDDVMIDGLVFTSIEECAKFICAGTNWPNDYVVNHLSSNQFLDYTISYVEANNEYSSIDDIEDWTHFLSAYYTTKMIHYIPTDEYFNTPMDLAVYLLCIGMYKKFSKAPLKTLTSEITKCLKNPNQERWLNIEYSYRHTENTLFEQDCILCDDMTFNGITDAAVYFSKNKLFGKKTTKTCKNLISEVLLGYFPDINGYTFKLNGITPEPKLMLWNGDVVPVCWEMK